MEQQEYLMKLQMFEQQTSHYREQLQVIDRQVVALNKLKENINKLKNSKESEMFSEVGKGIYVKGSLNKKQMLVDVGHKILVPKTGKEIKFIIDSQIKKFSEVKKEIANKVDKVNKEVDLLIKNVKVQKRDGIGKKIAKKK